MSGRGKAASPSSKCCATTTAMLNEALSVFTRLFVLCRRCRRPQTALFATEDNGARPFSAPRSGGSSSAYNGGGKSPAILAPSLAPSGSPRYEGWGVTLWVECQGEGCGLTSRVGGSGAAGSGGSGGTGPSPWLVKFSRYVLRRGWKVYLHDACLVPVLGRCVTVPHFPKYCLPLWRCHSWFCVHPTLGHGRHEVLTMHDGCPQTFCVSGQSLECLFASDKKLPGALSSPHM